MSVWFILLSKGKVIHCTPLPHADVCTHTHMHSDTLSPLCEFHTFECGCTRKMEELFQTLLKVDIIGMM